MSTVYVAPSIDTHDAVRTAQAVADFAPIQIKVSASAAITAAVSALHVIAKALSLQYNVNETAAQKAKGKV